MRLISCSSRACIMVFIANCSFDMPEATMLVQAFGGAQGVDAHCGVEFFASFCQVAAAWLPRSKLDECFTYFRVVVFAVFPLCTVFAGTFCKESASDILLRDASSDWSRLRDVFMLNIIIICLLMLIVFFFMVLLGCDYVFPCISLYRLLLRGSSGVGYHSVVVG